MNTVETGNTGIKSLFQAVFLECLYQRKFSKVMTRPETIDCLTGPRFEGSFLALLGFEPIYKIHTLEKGSMVLQIGKNVYLCESYACYELVIEGKERDKTFQSGRTDVLTWNGLCIGCGGDWIDKPIPDNDFEILKIALFEVYKIRL